MTDATRNLLEQHFDTAFAAPDGVARLRELILTLAMQGKLVAQDANDPPASELLKEIETEKQRLSTSSSPRRRGSRGGKGLDPRLRGNDSMGIKPEEVPYELPLGWEWVRLGEAASLITKGATPTTYGFAFESSGIPFVKVENVKNGSIKFTEKMQFISEAAHQYQKRSQLEEYDLLFSIAGTIGETCVVKEGDIPANINQALAIIRGYTRIFSPHFLIKALDSAVSNAIKNRARGAAMNNISLGDIKDMIIPAPPLPEQHRIVARIDQLMARCDALEKLRKEREEKRLAVHAAAIKQLLDTSSSPAQPPSSPAQPPSSPAQPPSSPAQPLSSPPQPLSSPPRRRGSSHSNALDSRLRGNDGEVSGNAWDFIQQHFGELYTVKENVNELSKAILQLAVMGSLVPQNPNDPPASELLKEIEAEKQRLVKAGKIKKPKSLPPIKPEEVPYELPQGWQWVRLNDALDVRDGTHDTPKYVDVGYPLVTSKNIYTGKLSLEDVKYISEEDHEKIAERSKVDKGDILFAMIGSIGNPVIVDSDVEFSIKNVALFKYFMDGKPNNRYLHYYLVHAQENMKAISSGAVQSFVSLGFLRNYPFPLPPLPEQHRIVARIDQLMALCNTLDQQIDAATGKQTKLLNAVMAQV